MNNNQTKNRYEEIDKKLLSYPFSLIFLNIRSLRKNFDNFIVDIQCILNELKIIILVETNITDDENDLYSIKGFNAIHLNRKDKCGGGIAIYIKETINYCKRSLETISFESIQVDLCINSASFSLLSIYRPPSQNTNNFITELDQIINKTKTKQEMIITGDINIDINKQNLTTTKYLEMLSTNGLECMINENTRCDINKNTNTCIDHLFIRCKQIDTQTNSFVITTKTSDHYSLFCSVNKENQGEEINNHQGAKKIKLNEYKVNNLIKQTKWNDIICKCENASDIYNKIYETFNDIYKKSTIIKKHNKSRSNNPWVNDEIIKDCNIRDKLYKKWKSNRQNKTYETNYKKFRNFLNKKIIMLKIIITE